MPIFPVAAKRMVHTACGNIALLSVVRCPSFVVIQTTPWMLTTDRESWRITTRRKDSGHEKIHSGGGIGHAALGSQPTTRISGRAGSCPLAALSALPLFT